MTARLHPRAFPRFLRHPALIIGELACLVLAGVLGASLPPAGSAPARELASWLDRSPVSEELFKLLALDHVFRSGWFLAVALLTSASLTVIVIEQWKRICSQWSQRLTPAHFKNAPFQAEFERPSQSNAVGRTLCWSERRLGLASSGVFHLGLLLIMLAGALRALFASDAVVDLLEGETLAPNTQAWGAQFPGILASPVQTEVPIRLEEVKVTRYETGDLREMNTRLTLHRQTGSVQKNVAVNHDLHIGKTRLFVGSDFGPSALIEWQSTGATSSREAILLRAVDRGQYEGISSGPNGMAAHLRAHLDYSNQKSKFLEVRVMKDNALLWAGYATSGQTLSAPGGIKLTIHGIPLWVRFHGSRDSALWLAYLGFALAMFGAALIFMVVKVDGCLMVTSLGDKERIFIALKPQKFAHLFQEKFKELVRENGGPATDAQNRTLVKQPDWPAASSGDSQPRADQNIAIPIPITHSAKWLWIFTGLILHTGCERSSLDQARQLVERYNQVVSEAYRRGDVKLADPVVGPNEGKKLTGLIGVRLDMGITLDSQLLSLEVTGVEQAPGEMKVRTRERWRYRDLKIGTGQQVGEESLDHYEMLYLFKKTGPEWLVDGIQFTAEPQVGRKTTTWAADVRTLHGVTPNIAKEETKQP